MNSLRAPIGYSWCGIGRPKERLPSANQHIGQHAGRLLHIMLTLCGDQGSITLLLDLLDELESHCVHNQQQLRPLHIAQLAPLAAQQPGVLHLLKLSTPASDLEDILKWHRKPSPADLLCSNSNSSS